jgi:hypothetical protein
MRKNSHTTPSRGAGSGAKTPAFNAGHVSVPKGTTKGSNIIKNSSGISSGQAGHTDSRKTQTPTTNYVNTTYKKGTTMHGVGQVPEYLKGKQGKSV